MTGKKSLKRIAAVGIAALALGGGGAAYAVGANGPGAGHGPGPGFAQAAATYLGLTAAELRTQLESGKTLAQIATAQGKTVAGLETAIYNGAKADLDAKVAAGTITSTQEATILADLKSHLDDIVNRTGPPRP